MTENYSDTHKSLIEQSKKGKRKAQTKIYHLYAHSMFNICVRMSNSFEEAEDLLQESFSEAFYKLDTFNYKSSFGAWLKRIVINKCINALKAKKIDFAFTDDVSTLPVDENDSEPEELKSLKVEQVLAGVKKLPDGYRTIFSLYLLEGYTHIEIAEIMKISVSTSKTQYFRAKKKLIEVLKDSSH